ncbi:Crp/Fnr family transcriptional regulator [Aliiruegeria sabulilitoris]|uniref:Crp/Fnr family transcriptional regulator n=1 Tax=Aliiruegeria sabulilitoris TaxID=1510458 RepID=UPI00082ADDD1|nr:Crp/Fnr family transcriptional regulator [Aliiruegeria sabulilitoris]NDR58158.1 Crp/Fnr family transcriptional regulator [Pseudoruegeria sp. M32A2M]
MNVSQKKVAKPQPLDQARSVLFERGWLAARDSATREALFDIGRLASFESGQPLYNLSDPPNGLFGIVSGVVQILIPGENKEMLTPHRAEAGFWVGDLALFSDQRRLVSVVARGPVQALFLPSTKLRELVRQHPDMMRDFYALTHANMQTALRLLANLSVTRSNSRIALRLLHIAESITPPDGWIELSQEELAEHTAVSLPTVQRCLRLLSEMDAIELGYGRLRLLDRDGLFRFASD